jgi:FkbM family methyltransferase
MILSTRTKIGLARAVQLLIGTGLRVLSKGPTLNVRRKGINWNLDLREGIDFAIYLLGSFEPRTLAAYRKLIPGGATVLDVGANIGAHTLHFAQLVGQQGKVIAVEPTAYAFNRLIENIGLNPSLARRIEAMQSMLMSTLEADLVEEIPSSWPLVTPEGAHAHHGGVKKSTKGATIITVDHLIKKLAINKLDFVKLDVDGYEVEVLRGAVGTLSQHSPVILFEHSPYTIAEKGYEPMEMIEIMRTLGYRFEFLGGNRVPDNGLTPPKIPAGAGINLVARRATG